MKRKTHEEFVNEANNKPMRIPSELSAIFAQYEIKE